MLSLSGNVWQRWEEKHAELTSLDKWNLASLFQGQEGPGFRAAAKRVLYTGKATAGPFETGIEEIAFGCNTNAFWSFARRLNTLTGNASHDLGNIAWSNLCKIGSANGNPGKGLVDAQADLAVETLRQEWKELKPTLVVCVAEGYCDHLVYRALGVDQGAYDGFEEVLLPEGIFWKRRPMGEMPSFLWMKHPQGKLRPYVNAAEAIAEEMLTS